MSPISYDKRHGMRNCPTMLGRLGLWGGGVFTLAGEASAVRLQVDS